MPMLLMEDGREMFNSLGQVEKADAPIRVIDVGRRIVNSDVHPEKI